MKTIWVVLASALAGFVGGILGSRIPRVSESAVAEQVVRGRRFELVDEAGKQISFWGINKDNYAVLAFGEYRPEQLGGSRNRAPIEDLRGQYLSIGVIDNNPFLDLKGSDGKTRMNLSVDMFNKPIVWMGDENGPRLHLGIVMSDTPGYDDNDWGLNFGPERAFIGMLTRQTGQRRFVRGALTLDTNEREILPKPTR